MAIKLGFFKLLKSFPLFPKGIFFFFLLWLHWVLVAAPEIFDLHCGKQYLLVAGGILSCGMWGLVPWPGIKPRPPALGAWSLSYYNSREVPHWRIFAHTISLVWVCSPPSLNEFLSLPSTFILLLKNLVSFYFWLCWVFIALCRLSLVVASGGYS